MAGNFRDPMVGRDLLIGGMLGLVHSTCINFGVLLPRWFGFVSPPSLSSNIRTLGSMRTMLAGFLNGQVVTSIYVGFAFLFFLLLLYIILRRQWLATVALFVTALAIEVSAFAASAPRLYWIASILIALTIVTVVARFGLLATMAAQLVFFLSLEYPMTTDFSVWYASSTIFALVIILGLAVYGFYISLGGQRVFAGRSFGLED